MGVMPIFCRKQRPSKGNNEKPRFMLVFLLIYSARLLNLRVTAKVAVLLPTSGPSLGRT